MRPAKIDEIMKTTITLTIAGLFLLSACDSTNSGELDDPIVVEAFLFAGEPIDDIHLSSVITLDSEDSLATPINDAAVKLVKEGIPDWEKKTLPQRRDPKPHNGKAAELFASDLLSTETRQLALDFEEREKELYKSVSD